MMETNRKEEAGAFTLEGARYRREPEGILLEQAAEAYTGQKRRAAFQVGKPPQADPPSPGRADNFDDLLALGQQFGNFTVK